MRPPPRDTSLRGRTVAVAGAGLAGLAAAWALERRGAIVRVFEARQRVGGRVLTVRNLPGAAHAEAGGDLIEKEDCRAMRILADAMNLSLTRVLPGGFRYYTGAPGTRGTMRGGHEMFDVLRERLQREIDAYCRSGENMASGTARALATRTALDWARTARGAREAVAAVEALRGFFLAEPSEYSLLMLVQQLSQEGDPASTTFYRVAGGNGRLPEALAESLAQPPELGVRLRALRAKRDVRLTLEGAARATCNCDALVIAVPATLAREIDFSPRLPDAQMRAIATLPYGRATNALVSFDRRFWRRRGRAFGSRMPAGAGWESGVSRRGGTLALLAGGDASAFLKDLVARGTGRDWLRALSWLQPGGARVLDATAVSWEDDPYARGAYAFHSPAFDSRLLPLLSAPAGRIAFAGEHTSMESQGYMEGAAMSGLRAADDIAAALR